MQDVWDIQNPERVTLPSCNAAICYDVKCIVAIGNNEIWVGAGPSIFFLDEQSLERRVSDPTRTHYSSTAVGHRCIYICMNGWIPP